MPNALWYGLICLLSTLLFGYTLYKHRSSKVIILYLFAAGITYLFEYFVLVIFNAYIYLPKVLKDAYFDNLVGSIISNAFIVPMSATLVGTLQLNWLWISVITIIILGIEELLLKLHIYEQYWWNTSYTGLCLIFAFYISKKLAIKLKTKPSRLVRCLATYFIYLFIQACLHFVLVAFFHTYFYQVGWFENPTRDHVAFATAFIIVLALIMVFLVLSNISWPWKISLFLGTMLLDIVLVQLNILHMSANWSLGYFLILRLFVLGILMLINREMLK